MNKKWIKISVVLVAAGALCVSLLYGVLFGSAVPSAKPTDEHVIYLDQGWNHRTRQTLSYTSFGSRFIPYDWFIALEQNNSRELFRAEQNMLALGFIPERADEFNPDALPVGLVRDRDPDQGDYVGLTCAACHTGQVSINGQRIRIDGGQALIDYTEFEQQVLAALKTTLHDKEKFARFYAHIISAAATTKKILTADELAAQLQTRINALEKHYAVNATEVPYGHGRLDAFGQIFNAIAAEALALPDNIRSPNAPTSFPVLWDASHLDVVQWNASAPNKEPGPLFQNAITALAVYGEIKIQKENSTYQSSIRIGNLGDIQQDYYQLVAPQWPVEFAGALDATKMAAGKQLYAQHCLQCHGLVDPTDKKRKLQAVLVPVTEVGTDPLMANNFMQHKVQSGLLAGEKTMVLFGPVLPAETSPLDLVTHAASGALFNQPWQTTKALWNELRSNNAPPVQTVYDSYKARPINGVWSSAPYLHNGSVPSIYDLLLPAALRPVSFYVGNIELDLTKVGRQVDETEYSSLYDTRLLGNANTGHEYGAQLAESARWELVEYIKSL